MQQRFKNQVFIRTFKISPGNPGQGGGSEKGRMTAQGAMTLRARIPPALSKAPAGSSLSRLPAILASIKSPTREHREPIERYTSKSQWPMYSIELLVDNVDMKLLFAYIIQNSMSYKYRQSFMNTRISAV